MSKKLETLIEVRDVVLWPQHIHGAPDLKKQLMDLKAEEIVRLRIDGKLTMWSRMKDGKDGRPTHGLKPCDQGTREFWDALYRGRRGELVDIKLSKPPT